MEWNGSKVYIDNLAVQTNKGCASHGVWIKLVLLSSKWLGCLGATIVGGS